MERGVLGSGLGAIGRVLLLRFLFDGLLEFLEDVELLELGVMARRHSKYKCKY